MSVIVAGSISGCVPDGGEQPGGVVVVEAGDGLAEVDGDVGGGARGQEQNAPYPEH
jgi:hypothetical protein